MARVICPFCLRPHDFTTSLKCITYQTEETNVPNVYAREYYQVPPLWLVTVGFPRHGKTTYLAALTLILENISSVWPGVHYRHLDQYTFDAIRKMRHEAKTGKLPGRTENDEVLRPLLFSMYNLPESGSRCLVMYDVPGQKYLSLNDVKYVTSIKQVSTTWFLVSLKDLQAEEEDKTITDLFQVYLSGMESLRIDLKGRNLIVVYTKADELDFTDKIMDYIQSDPFQGLTSSEVNLPGPEDFSYHNYIQEMKDISGQLEIYTRRHMRGGAAFINMVKASGMNLVFCAISALGQSPDGSDKLREDALRYRVLDPFLWAITLESSISSEPIGLVLDASSQSHLVYDETLLTNVWEGLSDQGELTTYYLGRTAPASTPRQQPPTSPPKVAHHRLIGPILEKASPKTRLMIITTGYIMDLADFYNSPWRDRLLLVTVDQDYQQDWPKIMTYRQGDDPLSLVEELLRL